MNNNICWQVLHYTNALSVLTSQPVRHKTAHCKSVNRWYKKWL